MRRNLVLTDPRQTLPTVATHVAQCAPPPLPPPPLKLTADMLAVLTAANAAMEQAAIAWRSATRTRKPITLLLTMPDVWSRADRETATAEKVVLTLDAGQVKCIAVMVADQLVAEATRLGVALDVPADFAREMSHVHAELNMALAATAPATPGDTLEDSTLP